MSVAFLIASSLLLRGVTDGRVLFLTASLSKILETIYSLRDICTDGPVCTPFMGHATTNAEIQVSRQRKENVSKLFRMGALQPGAMPSGLTLPLPPWWPFGSTQHACPSFGALNNSPEYASCPLAAGGMGPGNTGRYGSGVGVGGPTGRLPRRNRRRRPLSFASYSSIGLTTIPIRNGVNVRTFQSIQNQVGLKIRLSEDGKFVTLAPGVYEVRGFSVVQRLHPGVPVPADQCIGYAALVKAEDLSTANPNMKFLAVGSVFDPANSQTSLIIDQRLYVRGNPLTLCMILQHGLQADGLLAQSFEHEVKENHVFGRLVFREVHPEEDELAWETSYLSGTGPSTSYASYAGPGVGGEVNNQQCTECQQCNQCNQCSQNQTTGSNGREAFTRYAVHPQPFEFPVSTHPFVTSRFPC